MIQVEESERRECMYWARKEGATVPVEAVISDQLFHLFPCKRDDTVSMEARSHMLPNDYTTTTRRRISPRSNAAFLTVC